MYTEHKMLSDPPNFGSTLPAPLASLLSCALRARCRNPVLKGPGQCVLLQFC